MSKLSTSQSPLHGHLPMRPLSNKTERHCEYGDDLIRPRPAGTARDAESQCQPILAGINAWCEHIARLKGLWTEPHTHSAAGLSDLNNMSDRLLAWPCSIRAEIPMAFMEVAMNDIPKALLTSYGDYTPSLDHRNGDYIVPEASVLHRLVGQYFGFATPTYRYLHRPSLEHWASQLSEQDHALSDTKGSLCTLGLRASLVVYHKRQPVWSRQ